MDFKEMSVVLALEMCGQPGPGIVLRAVMKVYVTCRGLKICNWKPGVSETGCG